MMNVAFKSDTGLNFDFYGTKIKLPKKIVNRILFFINYESFIQLRRVSREFKILAENKYLLKIVIFFHKTINPGDFANFEYIVRRNHPIIREKLKKDIEEQANISFNSLNSKIVQFLEKDSEIFKGEKNANNLVLIYPLKDMCVDSLVQTIQIEFQKKRKSDKYKFAIDSRIKYRMPIEKEIMNDYWKEEVTLPKWYAMTIKPFPGTKGKCLRRQQMMFERLNETCKIKFRYPKLLFAIYTISMMHLKFDTKIYYESGTCCEERGNDISVKLPKAGYGIYLKLGRKTCVDNDRFSVGGMLELNTLS